jgi:hypothetical protein
MPDVRELADAIAIAFDDLRGMTRPGEAETDDAPEEGLVSKATQRLVNGLAGGIGNAMTGMVGKAAAAAVSRATAPKTRRRAG